MKPRDKFELANAILRDRKLSPATRLVGLYIADLVNLERGYSWPPQELIAADLGISERTVRRAIIELACYFQITRRHRLANEYRPLTGQNVRSNRSLTGQIVHSNRTNCALSPAKMSSHPSYDPTSDPKTLVSRATRRRRTTDKEADEKFEAFKTAYPARAGSQGWQSASKHFDAAVKSGVAADDLIAAAGKFANALPVDTRGTKFVPMAETWLRKKNWQEYLPSPADREALAEREAAAAKAAKRLGYELTEDGFKKVESHQ